MPDDLSVIGTAPTRPARRAEGTVGIRKWLSWILAAGALAACLLLFDLGDMLAKVRQLTAREIALVLVLLTFDRLLMALKWRLLLEIGGAHLPPALVIRIYYQGWLVGAFLPTHLGGDLLRAHLVAQRTGVVHPAFASVVMEKVIGLISAVNWAIAGGVVLGCWLEPGRLALWIGLGVLAALAFNGLFVASQHDAVHDFALRTLARYHQSRLMGMLHRFYGAYADFSRHPKTLALNLLLTILEHGLQLLILYTIVTSLDVAVGPVVFFAAAAVRMLILRIPVTPDGWGTGELAAIAVFGTIGIGAAAAFATSVICRFLGIVATLPGFAALVLPRDFVLWSESPAREASYPDQPAPTTRRLVMYLGGCLCFSLGVKLFIDADLGVDPFHAMTIGLVEAVGVPYLQIGFMDGLVTAALLVVWMIWNRRLPPLTTFVTMLMIGLLIDAWNGLAFDMRMQVGSRALPLLAGLVLNAYGAALIIMSGIGIRVVDLVALTLVKRVGARFYVAKLALEAGFLLVGFLLGGPVGIAALVFVCVVGPFVEPLIWANRRFLKLPDHGLRPAMSRH
ncbi:MAG TPA: flippase-like domain-containing protein [Geminicoccaceae bacterium]|nr:flippase-like domain-containing protein [Geminicoccaceae bacterium]